MLRFLRTFWPWLLATAGYVAIAILIFVPFEAGGPLHILLFLLAFFAIQLTAVCLHEFGHLLACIILRELPALVEIGKGDILIQFRFGPIGLRLRATTNSGCVWSKHHFENFNRADMSLLYAAGPLVDLALVALVLWFLAKTPETVLHASHFDHQIKPLLIITGAYIFYYQLWYLFHRSSYKPGEHSDAGGLAALWHLLAAPDNVRRGYVRTANDFVVRELADRPKLPFQADAAGAAITTLSANHDHGIASAIDTTPRSSVGRDEPLDIQAFFQWLLSRPNLPPDHADQVKDAFITNVVRYNLAEQLPLADQYSAELLAKAPDKITYAGSRGSVLVALGQIDAGKPLLENVYAASDSPIDRSISASFLALAEHRSGNPAAARDWLNKAVAANPACPSIKLALAELN